MLWRPEGVSNRHKVSHIIVRIDTMFFLQKTKIIYETLQPGELFLKIISYAVVQTDSPVLVGVLAYLFGTLSQGDPTSC